MRIDVVYASKHGSTREIAEAIAAELAKSGADARAQSVSEASLHDVAGADAVVLGSALYFGHWLESATWFMSELAQVAGGRPVWLFSSGPVGAEVVEPTSELFGKRELDGLRGHRVFGGKLQRDALDPTERAVASALGASDGDARDWDEIRAWAREIAEQVS